MSDNGEVAGKEATQCVGSEAGVFDIFLSLLFISSPSLFSYQKKKKVVRKKKKTLSGFAYFWYSGIDT